MIFLKKKLAGANFLTQVRDKKKEFLIIQHMVRKCNGLFTLHGIGTEGGTGNGPGTIGSKGSWYLFLSETCVDILHTILEPIEPCPVGGPVQCEHTIVGYEFQTMNTMYLSKLNNSIEYHMIRFVFLFILKEYS